MPQDKSLAREENADDCAARQSAAAEQNWILSRIPRWRGALFGVVGLLLILSFNGQWRVGRDSAAYRGLAHQLATTGKYVFRENVALAGYTDQSDTRYPGMPVLLAAVEKGFGPADAPAVGVVLVMGVGVLLLTALWVRTTLPLWAGAAVVFGLGANGRFIEHCNEILSDVPFLLGVMGLLVVFDRLLRAKVWPRRAAWMAGLVACLLFLAVMRPTFWIIGAALAATCIWGIFGRLRATEQPAEARTRRITCLLTLGLLALAAAVFWFGLDPRGKKVGIYEKAVDNMLTGFRERVVVRLPQNLHEMLEQALPESFFGTQLGPGFITAGREVGRESRAGKPLRWGLSSLFSLILIGGGIGLARRSMLCGMIVLATVGTMLLLGSVPRYFLMVLPLLLAGWGLWVEGIARRAARWGHGAGEAVVFFGLGLVVAPNLLHAADTIREQHGFTRPKVGIKQVGFIEAYHGGQWADAYAVAKMIRDYVNPGERVIGPESTVLTYLSGRDVYGMGMLLPRKDTGGIWERSVRRYSKPTAANNGFYFAYAVFPDGANQLYNDKDQLTAKLIRLGILKPVKVIARSAGYALATYEVVHVEKKRGRGLRGKDLARMNLAPGAILKPGTRPTAAPSTSPSTRPRGVPGRGLRGKDNPNSATSKPLPNPPK